jgi:hypothetical protein
MVTVWWCSALERSNVDPVIANKTAEARKVTKRMCFLRKRLTMTIAKRLPTTEARETISSDRTALLSNASYRFVVVGSEEGLHLKLSAQDTLLALRRLGVEES